MYKFFYFWDTYSKAYVSFTLATHIPIFIAFFYRILMQ